MSLSTFFDIHILVADNDCFLTSGLVQDLGKEPGIIVQEHANNFDELCELAKKHQPAVIILESRLRGIDAPSAIKKLTAASAAAIILYEDSVTLFHFQYYYNKDIRGIVRKGQQSQVLVRAIREVWHGGTYYCCHTQKLLKEHPYVVSGKSFFKDHELQILQHLFEGKTRPEIAGLLFKDAATIDSSIHKMLDKCHCTTSIALIGFATHHRFIKKDAEP